MNKYISALVNFVKSNDNWKELLKEKPYSLKTIKECSYHPNWYMFVYNLFNSELTNDVVRGCRGTVLEINGKNVKVISAPYTKFFNYGQIEGKDIEENINWNNASIQLKCDGILIKTAKVENRLYFFTNGSFELNAPFEDSNVYDEIGTRGAETYGDLLKYALSQRINDEIFFDKETGEFYCKGKFANTFPEGSTIMLELTSPRNKIICEYRETKLWCHGYRNSLGIEIDPRTISDLIPFDMPPLYNAHNYDELKEILKTFKGNEQEGVVVVDYSTIGTPRTKIKCDDYLRLKFTRDSACNIQMLFKAVVDNEYDDLVANIPAVLPKIEEIKENVEEFEKWFSTLVTKAEIFKRNNSIKKDWVMYVRKLSKENFSYYMDAWEGMYKCEKKLRNLSIKKHGYDEVLRLINRKNSDNGER